MKNRATRSIEDFANSAEKPSTAGHPEETTTAQPEESSAQARFQRRLATGRRFPIQNILGNDSVKQLLDHAAARENMRTQDLIRTRLMIPLEEQYGTEVPFEEQP